MIPFSSRPQFETAYLVAVIDTATLVVVEVFVASAPAEGLTLRKGQAFATLRSHTSKDFATARAELLHAVRVEPWNGWLLPVLREW